MAQLDLRCPTCGQVDKVEKVSVIAGGDAIPVQGEYGPHTYPTALAKSLARPSKPTMNSTLIGCGFVIGVIILAMGFLAFSPQYSNSVERGTAIAMVGFGLVLCFLVFLGNSGAKKSLEDQLPLWQKADERWKQLYYCRRDETVFNPYDGSSAPAGEMEKYLYS